jgi:hypothetical protein
MELTASNIERFDEVTGRVLGALYESFPVSRSLLIEHFVPDGYLCSAAVDANSPNDNGRFFIASVDWLSNAGFISVNGRDPRSGFGDCVLTAKGLEVLKALPASLQSGPTLGEKLIDASKGGIKEVLRGVTSEVLSLGVRIVSKSYGLP